MTSEAIFELYITFTLYYGFYLVSHTIIHELGHALAALFFNSKNKALIQIRFAIDRCIFKSDKLQIQFKKNLPGRLGKTYLEDEFLGYSEKEIKIIAMAGPIAQTIYGMIILGIFLMHNSSQSPIIKMIFAILFLFTFYVQYYDKGQSEYCDRNIVKNPSKFLVAIKTNEINDDDTYQNQIKK